MGLKALKVIDRSADPPKGVRLHLSVAGGKTSVLKADVGTVLLLYKPFKEGSDQ